MNGLNGGTQGPRFIIHELSALAEKTPVVARYTEVHRVGPTTEPFSKSSFPIPGNNGWKICIPSMAQNIPQQPVRLITHYHNQSTTIYIYLIYTHIYIYIPSISIYFSCLKPKAIFGDYIPHVSQSIKHQQWYNFPHFGPMLRCRIIPWISGSSRYKGELSPFSPFTAVAFTAYAKPVIFDLSLSQCRAVETTVDEEPK